MELEAVEPHLRALLTLAVQERFTVDRQDQVVWDVVGKVAVLVIPVTIVSMAGR